MPAFADEGAIEALVHAFAHAKVGVIAIGVPEDADGNVTSTDANPVSLGNTTHGDGKQRVVAFADPEEFVKRFGQPFNAEMLGIDVYRTVDANATGHGVLVNSATSETSMIISRASAEVFLAGDVRGERRPWWKFW